VVPDVSNIKLLRYLRDTRVVRRFRTRCPFAPAACTPSAFAQQPISDAYQAVDQRDALYIRDVNGHRLMINPTFYSGSDQVELRAIVDTPR
jgi:hypothetical protein